MYQKKHNIYEKDLEGNIFEKKKRNREHVFSVDDSRN